MLGAAKLNHRYTATTSTDVISVRTEPRRHRKLYHLMRREEKEEGLRDFLPPQPLLPSGWSMTHTPGSNRFDLLKTIEVRGCGVEEMHIITLMESKQYEGTYRMDNGEREEQEYLNFSLFLKKKRFPNGGLEFGLTSIDMELVMDSLVMHPTDESFMAAKLCYETSSELREKRVAQRTNYMARMARDSKYRGPMLSELDDDLSDEILDYLDERGVNNAFSEYIMSQAYFFEQQEYLHWIRLLTKFSD